ncbi:MAG TPA: ATP-binding protein [Longimicrobiales bacterium]
MSARRPRLRWHVVAGFLASAAGAALVLYLRIPTVARARLADRLPPAELDALTEALRQSALLAGALGLGIALALALFLAGAIAAGHARLRADLLRLAREPAARMPPQSFAELEPIAAASARLAAELSERAARAARERDDLALLLDSVTDGILQLGRGGRIIRVNPAARELLRLPLDAEGRPIHALVRHAELRELLTQAVAAGPGEPAEVGLDGRRVLVVVRAIPAHAGSAAASDRDHPGIVAVFVDLTEVRRLEVVRRDFVANASHELKTPLTAIRGYAETLLAGDVPAELQRDFLETIARNAARLQSIVDDLLDLSRIESGGWKPEIVATEVAAAAEDAWAPFAERACSRSVHFDVAADGVTVLADPGALRQIFGNLFDNALRHTPAGGRISVRAAIAGESAGKGPGPDAALPKGRRSAAARVAIEVRDTGSGIPSDALPRIFERFYRVDPARSRAEGGTGLGLAIVKHLVEAMGGEVAADSVLGKGTTIRFTLPASPLPVESAADAAAQALSATGAPDAAAQPFPAASAADVAAQRLPAASVADVTGQPRPAVGPADVAAPAGNPSGHDGE